MNYNINFDFGDANSVYLTHSLHPYPAKFPPQLPNTILKQYGHPGEIVLDPFSGSGTTLVEARLLGFNAIGVDVNGLSSLLSKVKATPMSELELQEAHVFLDAMVNYDFEWTYNRPSVQIKEFDGRDHWFQKNVAEELSFIIGKINEIPNINVRDFYKIVVSSIIVKVSNQESDTRFAAKDKGITDNYTFVQFINKAKEYLERMTEFSQLVPPDTTLRLINADSRHLDMLEKESVDIIITSPPYANTYDYYLYHKFRKIWLDIDVKFAQNNEIGSRREYSSLKKPAEQWTIDLKACFSEMYRLLKKGGHAFIVIGDSVIKKELIHIDEVISSFAPEMGFEVCNIISTSLSSHSRVFNPSFTQKDKKEHLIILKK